MFEYKIYKSPTGYVSSAVNDSYVDGGPLPLLVIKDVHKLCVACSYGAHCDPAYNQDVCDCVCHV